MNGFPPSEMYWLGVAIWLLGFVFHVYGAYWRHSYTAARIGTVLCWIGFSGTAMLLIKEDLIPSFEWPEKIDIRNPTTEQIFAVIWMTWIVGFSLVILSWFRIMARYIGWAGFTVGMAATVASWTQDKQVQAVIAGAALILIFLLVASKISGSKRAARPGDYQAELLKLCYGDTAVASRLIRDELKRRPGFSRQAAAMAAVTRLKHDRR